MVASAFEFNATGFKFFLSEIEREGRELGAGRWLLVGLYVSACTQGILELNGNRPGVGADEDRVCDRNDLVYR